MSAAAEILGLAIAITYLNEAEPLPEVSDEEFKYGIACNRAWKLQTPSSQSDFYWIPGYGILQATPIPNLPEGGIRYGYSKDCLNHSLYCHRYMRNGGEVCLLHSITSSERRLVGELRRPRNALNKIHEEGSKSSVGSEAGNEQWNAIRSLRKSSNSLHRAFLDVAARGSQGARKLRHHCRNSANFLETGIATFRDVLHKETPASLKEVFAFVSLSYVMSTNMAAKTTMKQQDELMSGLPVWRQAIAEESERIVLDEVVEMLWPDVSSRLHQSATGADFLDEEMRKIGDEAETTQVSGAESRGSPPCQLGKLRGCADGLYRDGRDATEGVGGG
ncbi:MAG: hypothetical protein M1833_005746 [Piccolia ochrophora]|nr:MAG: hypothetical protein M1833_005746 [Piccolia ochrophora]